MQGQAVRAAVSSSAASEWTVWRWVWVLALGMAVLLSLGGPRVYAMGQAQAAPAETAPHIPTSSPVIFSQSASPSIR